MLSPELLQKVQNIFIRSRHRVNDVFAGEYESAFRGRGIEFEEFREYVPGDDVRQIDWNVTARMDRPFVKVFREEREQTIFFMVDVSRSLFFGQNKDKLEVATEIAALLSYAAIKSNDKVGLILFSDQIEKYIPPKKGRGHVWNIIATVLTHKAKGRKTNLENAVGFFLKVARRKTTAFMISDFFAENYSDALRVAGMKHDLVAVRIIDDLEKKFAGSALMNFEDLESGQRFSMDLGKNSKKAEQNYEAMTRVLTGLFGSAKIDYLELRVNDDYVDQLMKFFLLREKKR